MNNLSYWLYVAGSSLAVLSMVSPGGNGVITSYSIHYTKLYDWC